MTRREAKRPKPVVMAAYAESASGPGWGNSPIWVILRDPQDGRLTQECIQPGEQTAEMLALYGVSRAVHSAMTNAVIRTWNKRVGK